MEVNFEMTSRLLETSKQDALCRKVKKYLRKQGERVVDVLRATEIKDEEGEWIEAEVLCQVRKTWLPILVPIKIKREVIKKC